MELLGIFGQKCNRNIQKIREKIKTLGAGRISPKV
ncbi:hypothetical protein CLOBOL_03826 [Enterocloster bolteae ATCC BAA-613]|uniref:Uncharacterized protein n=1 Tax=Enterocloster bolteae (strain ATCC BAA-613 / DSM 15670 / CCUG 46953 / JCM 12243 / WAL 16351) TaxID=411902 RepID=A8RTX7_ENTBW|nr:hypothetical protein CLOBOL_03826 [Enterocloster bolteae ATCC BAA-613]